MVINFIDNYADIIKRLYGKEWPFVFEGLDSKGIIDKFLTLEKLLIEKRPRKVYISQEFKCPPGLEKNIEKLIGNIKEGESLTPHLTTNIIKNNFNDYLLNDWNITHLHHEHERMNTKKNKFKNFNGRDKFVLFGIFLHDEAFIIQVWNHNNWGDTEILEIAHRNWPEILAPCKIPGATGENITPSSSQREEGRKGSILFVSMKDGTVYRPPGLGSSTSGMSLMTTKLKIHIFNTLRDLKTVCLAMEDKFIEGLKEHSKDTKELELQLGYQDSKLILFEGNLGIPIYSEHGGYGVDLTILEELLRKEY